MLFKRQNTKIGPESAAKLKDYVCSKLVDGQTVILDMHQGKYLGLDRTGAEIWAFIQAGARLQEIIDTITDEYQVDKARVSDDVIGFVIQLEAKGLIEVH